MKTAHKLILKSYLGPMFLTFFIVMFVLIMQFMWRYIDELVGKGLGVDVILELMLYASITLIPMGLPLATLLAAIMTMGDLGEHYELLALKSAGVSLPRILKPLAIVVLLISIASFFVSNDLVPMASRKMATLLYDIRRQKQNIEFKDGIFFNGIDGISIRVGEQDSKTHLSTDILIYDNRKISGEMTTTKADSGYIRLSDDKRYLMISLFSGESYVEGRTREWNENSTLQRNMFDKQDMIISTSGFDMSRSDESLFSGPQTKNIQALEVSIDSLQNVNDSVTLTAFGPLLRSHLFAYDHLVSDSMRFDEHKQDIDLLSKIDDLTLNQKNELYKKANDNARNAQNFYGFDEEQSKRTLNDLYRHKIAWHQKMSLPVSILIFFLIGAPLGAIIRKGGLGTPIVVSVAFFVIYYIITITGEKMAREGSWTVFLGMWVSTFILFPIAIYLTYKATNDSNLLNSEWYFNKFKQLKEFFLRVVARFKKRTQKTTT